MGDLAQQLTDFSQSMTPLDATLDEWLMVQKAAAALSRATDEEALARVIAQAHDGWAMDNSPLSRPAYVAKAVCQHITEAPHG